MDFHLWISLLSISNSHFTWYIRFWFEYVCVIFYFLYFSRDLIYIFFSHAIFMHDVSSYCFYEKSRISICTCSFYVVEMNTIPLEISRDCFFFVIYLIVDESRSKNIRKRKKASMGWTKQKLGQSDGGCLLFQLRFFFACALNFLLAS